MRNSIVPLMASGRRRMRSITQPPSAATGSQSTNPVSNRAADAPSLRKHLFGEEEELRWGNDANRSGDVTGL